jgi:hypothetical protein
LSAAAALYFGVRHLSQGQPAVAQQHARWIARVEHDLGINRESWVQQHTLDHRAIEVAANDIYIYGHWPLIIAALIYLFARHRDHFIIARNGMLLSGGIALGIFAAFPVAPPRLANPAIVDTVTTHVSAYRVLQPTAFTNAYAAMPSLHCGWDLLIAMTLAQVVGSRIARTVVRIVPMLMIAAVVITGNHYLIDAVVGDLLAFAALLTARSCATSRGDSKQDARASLTITARPITGTGRLAESVGVDVGASPSGSHDSSPSFTSEASPSSPQGTQPQPRMRRVPCGRPPHTSTPLRHRPSRCGRSITARARIARRDSKQVLVARTDEIAVRPSSHGS